jgi:hypothetical protein
MLNALKGKSAMPAAEQEALSQEMRTDMAGKLRSALSGITFGAAPRIVSALDKLTGEGGDNDATYAKAVADHPGANIVGSLLAPVPGMKGGGALKTLASRALPGAIVSGATSAFRGDSPGEVLLKATGARGLQQAASDVSDGHWGRATLDVLGAGGVGSALLGTGASVAGDALSAAAPKLERASNRLAARAVRGTAGEYKKLGDEGVQQVGDFLHRKGAIGFGDTIHALAPKVDAARAEAAQGMEAALAKAEAEGVRIPRSEYAQRLLNEAIEAQKYGPAAKDRVAQLLKAAQEAEESANSLGRDLTPAEAELWKQGYQEKAYPRGEKPLSPSPAQATDMDIARHAKEVTENALEAGIGGTPSADAYRAAKGDYGAAVTLNRMLGGAEGREIARNMASPSTKAHLITGLAMSHPVTGLAAAGANHLIGPRISSSAAVTARALSDFLAGGGASEAISEALPSRTAALLAALRSEPRPVPVPAGALSLESTP